MTLALQTIGAFALMFGLIAVGAVIGSGATRAALSERVPPRMPDEGDAGEWLES